MSNRNNIIDLKRHPLCIKKVMDSQFKSIDDILPLDKFNEYMDNLNRLNKQVDKLNKRVEKKLKKLEEELKDK